LSELSVLRAFCQEGGIPLDEEREAAFVAFREALYRTNSVMNLTRVPFEGCELRHFVDSLLIASLIPRGARVVDVGTGPGFPAWPLARARPDLTITAVDSSNKMLGFLRRHPLPNLEVVLARAEDWGVRDAFDVGTGRALAPLQIQLELIAPLVVVGGAVIPFRTVAEEEAISSFPGHMLGLTLESVVRRALPGEEIVRLFPVFRKVSSTPPKYPRTWAQIRARPLGTMPA